MVRNGGRPLRRCPRWGASFFGGGDWTSTIVSHIPSKARLCSRGPRVGRQIRMCEVPAWRIARRVVSVFRPPLTVVRKHGRAMIVLPQNGHEAYATGSPFTGSPPRRHGTGRRDRGGGGDEGG